MRQTILIFIAFFCIFNFGCNGRGSDKSFDMDSVVKAVNKIPSYYPSQKKIRGSELAGMTVEKLMEKYGIPLSEQTDTFQWGVEKSYRKICDIFYDSPGFVEVIERIPEITFRQIIWSAGVNKGINIYYVVDSENKCVPVWGVTFDYTPEWIPYYSMKEKGYTKKRMIEEYGNPEKENIDTMYFGRPKGKDNARPIDLLKDTAVKVIQECTWAKDSAHKITLIYLANDADGNAIWGCQFATKDADLE